MSVLLAIAAFYNSIPDWLKKLVGIVLVLAIVFLAGDQRGKRVAREECEAMAKRAQTAADAQDLQAEREGRAQDLLITNSLTQQTKDDDAKIKTLEAQLKGKGCLYDKSTADPVEQPRRMRKP